MNLVKVPENREDEMLQEFVNTSAFTFEGIDIHSKEGKEGLKKLEEVLRKTGYTEKHCYGYWFTGAVMNRAFRLTDSNAYPDDLTFLVIPNYYNPIVKLECGARWFDDIVANNAIKQNAINYGHKPDFDEDDDEEEF